LKWVGHGLALPAAFLVGCSSPSQPVRPEEKAPLAHRARRPEAEPSQSRATSWGRRTLLYPVRWGRAEDLAQTLEPILERMYGPGARIVAQRESNSLLIVLPERDETLGGQQGGARAAPPRRTR
jgi:hypothetical protein